MGQRCFGWHAPCNDVGGCRSLSNPAFAGTTSIFRAAGDNHPELGGDDIQPLADVLPDDMAFPLMFLVRMSACPPDYQGGIKSR